MNLRSFALVLLRELDGSARSIRNAEKELRACLADAQRRAEVMRSFGAAQESMRPDRARQSA